jgi:putative peptidoglycan lipid II flippase
MPDSTASIFASARQFLSGTVLSRILGMVRDLVMAFCFGSAPQVALFMVAYRWANLLRRLFGEGNVQGGFVPHFEQLRLKSEEDAAQFYRDVRISLILTVGGLTACCMLFCWGIFSLVPSDLPLMILFMLPGALFLILYALNSSVLHCQRRSFLPAFAPALFNLVWIFSAYAVSSWNLRNAMLGLSIMMIGAFAAQWGATEIPFRRWSHLRGHPFSPGVRGLLKPFSLGVLGSGAAQINSALDPLFAAWADPSGPAYLWYAIRIQQLPLAIFGIALTSSLLPPLSRAFQEGALLRYRTLLYDTIRKSLFLMIPCTAFLLLFAERGVRFLYGHGAFLEQDVIKTAGCLQGYVLGLAPMALTLLLANGFYAQKEYKIPMQSAILAIGCNIVLNTIFVFGFAWGAESIALATTLSNILNCWVLFRKYGTETRTQEEY